MKARALGVAALLAVAGAAGGYLLADRLEPAPEPIRVAAPVAGESPSYPSDPEVEVLPDPATPPLAPAIPLREARIGSRSFGVSVPVPDGWLRNNDDLVQARWKPPGSPLNTYFLRVKIVSGLHLTVEQALAQRLAELESVVVEWELESRTEDTFVASYVNDSYRRLAMERYLSLGSTGAYVTIVVIGRLSDRLGMADLLERVTDGASR
ncbi:MAG: hypothetical protein WCS84_10075 [Nocardioides sp.]